MVIEILEEAIRYLLVRLRSYYPLKPILYQGPSNLVVKSRNFNKLKKKKYVCENLKLNSCNVAFKSLGDVVIPINQIIKRSNFCTIHQLSN